MVLHRFHISQNSNLKSENLSHTITLLKEKKPAAYQRLSEAYDTIFADIRYFPLAKQKQAGHSRQFFFENSYGDMRSYGGNRIHEGTDIFGIHTAPGIYPIISVSDGIIENIRWLPLGGYRIGIRSPHGCYFYYAHLASYEQNFKEGDMVRAGEILGLMGDTGYGDEGMRG
ncbi:MAG: M23 family metallopeptidase, partial [Clostridia bacterium]|nr:M23 family metallopeptidase [Clostridia bacterium]